MFGIVKRPIITIIGAGAYGTAIAIALARNGNRVILWGHNFRNIRVLKYDRSNQIRLPNIIFPDSLQLEESLSVALNLCQDILIAVPSHVFGIVLTKLRIVATTLNSSVRIIIASKGLESQTGRLLSDIVYDIFGNDIPCAIISGPTFARELAMGMPTAVTLASVDIRFSYDVEHLLCSIRNFRVYKDTDIIGVQIAGAVKNVIAIGVGIADGVGFGANTRTALITRGLTEMSRLGIAMGSTFKVFTGLSGLGDLVLSCTDNQSRNRRFGVLLGQGVNIISAQEMIGQIIEGIYSTKEVYRLSIKYGVVMPITRQIYQVLYKNKSINDAVYSLLKSRNEKVY